jgi:glycosyltransferase involved in cell wall biosynthesis
MISIVTGTLNRKFLLEKVIENTINVCDKLELVLVDGGSTDGTIEYVKSLQNDRIKLIEVGERSSYPHFMNLGIKNSSYEWVCQWNDDALLVNKWEEVISELDNDHDFYLFNWKYGSMEDMSSSSWLEPTENSNGWFICDAYGSHGEIVVNYGIYNKKIFREIGMYSSEFKYYFADGDMSRRAYLFGYKYKALNHVKVCSIHTSKNAYLTDGEAGIYFKNHDEYKNKIINDKIEFLK